MRWGMMGLVALLGCKQSIGDGQKIRQPDDPPPGTNDGGTIVPPVITPYVASDSVVRRLSQSELDHTLFDLVGDTTSPASQYLLEDEFSPYDNDYGLQEPSQALVDAVDVLATEVSERLIADPARRSLVVPCTPAN